MWRLFKWCGWLILIGAAACAPAIAPNATQSPLASTSPLAPPPAVDSWVIRYHRSGGIAGVDETWTIFADGKVQYAGKGAEGPMQIAPDQMNALIAAALADGRSYQKPISR